MASTVARANSHDAAARAPIDVVHHDVEGTIGGLNGANDVLVRRQRIDARAGGIVADLVEPRRQPGVEDDVQLTREARWRLRRAQACAGKGSRRSAALYARR
jgi:hypothetical protein